MLIKNNSSGKTLEITRENYEKFLKGKENFSIVSENDPVEHSQAVDNSVNTTVSKVAPAVSKDDITRAEGKKTNKTNTNKNSKN